MQLNSYLRHIIRLCKLNKYISFHSYVFKVIEEMSMFVVGVETNNKYFLDWKDLKMDSIFSFLLCRTKTMFQCRNTMHARKLSGLSIFILEKLLLNLGIWGKFWITWEALKYIFWYNFLGGWQQLQFET